ncbi:MAG: FAD:protein FMN transferase [Clostridiales bacterium]|nr:FAD:protein FMN transferase [Clostridiales bacterium]
MKHKLTTAFLITALLFSGCSSGEKTTAEEQHEATETIFAMDTTMTITAYGENAEDAVDAAAAEIAKLDRLFSVTDENSDIYKLNTEKTAQVSEDTYNLIEEALSCSERTNHILNPAIYPVVKAWGFTTGNYRIPGEEELNSLKTHIDPNKIVLDNETMTAAITDPELEIDLGSVAKGYTSGKISELFNEMGIQSGIISLGGNVQTIGKKTDGSQWRVAVLDPKNQSEYAGIIETDNKAVITSGDYQRFFEENGKIYHHIIDPSTCAPAESGLSSVTIVSENSTAADAYSTALFIMGKEKAADFWRQNKDDFDAVFITNKGEIFITEGLQDCFTPTDKNKKAEIISAEN